MSPAGEGTGNRQFRRPKRRTIVRCLAFAAAVVLALPWLPWPQAMLMVPAASPFVTIATTLASRTMGLAAIVAFPILVLVLIRRRWFCRWACPVGLLTECVGRVSPVSAARCRRLPRIGTGLVLLSVSAAVVGYPLFLWLDPLAVFCGTLGLATDVSIASARLAAGVLVSIVVLSFALPGVWCIKLCPLGATQDLLARPRLWFRQDRIAGEADTELLAEPIRRRDLLATGVGATCALAGASLGLSVRGGEQPAGTVTLRPPGAAPLWQYSQLCVRCGNCLRICPSKIITTKWQSASWSDWLAPEVAFESDYCREDCVACMDACPSGALTRPPGKTESKAAIGLARVWMDRCLLALGRECQTMCLTSCPYEAITLNPWSWEDDRRYPIVASEKCPGCGACQVACTPMDAIVVQAKHDLTDAISGTDDYRNPGGCVIGQAW